MRSRLRRPRLELDPLQKICSLDVPEEAYLGQCPETIATTAAISIAESSTKLYTDLAPRRRGWRRSPRTPVPHAGADTKGLEPPVIFLVDDDKPVRETLRDVLEDNGRVVKEISTCEEFL